MLAWTGGRLEFDFPAMYVAAGPPGVFAIGNDDSSTTVSWRK